MVRVFSTLGLNAGKYGPEKLRIGTLFTQWQITVYHQNMGMILTKVADLLSLIKLPLIKLPMQAADAIIVLDVMEILKMLKTIFKK